ncbi:MAG: SDR family NAD(P)-dependent oxidoreductase [Cytophagales bacterium]|nr:SDR family NAD(P)-dependent oxidoreductase [Armatimonadota bacterium]
MTKTSSFPYPQSAALVTGASRGIGAAIARELARRGIAALALTARTAADLDRVADEIRSAFPATRIEVIAADLAEPDAPAFLKAETDRIGLSVDLLINNAGFGSYGLFDESESARNTAMVEVNIAALVKLTHLYLPEMRARGRGGILNVASTAAFQAVPYLAAYSATKAFVLSFSEAVWAETQEWNPPASDVRVVCLCPGGTDTNFGDGMDRGRFENGPQSTPEEVAVGGLDALDRNASYVVVGLSNYVGTLGSRLLPRARMARMTASMFRPLSSSGPAESEKTRRYLAAGGIVAAIGVVGVLLAAAKRRGD